MHWNCAYLRKTDEELSFSREKNIGRKKFEIRRKEVKSVEDSHGVDGRHFLTAEKKCFHPFLIGG
jgi:hypothetical protein